MNHLSPTKQLFRAVLICLLFLSGIQLSRAQVDILAEDFESSPVTSFYNLGDVALPDGASPCSKASRGNNTDLNSTNVDFLISSYFMGANPESPCGGFYTATVFSDTLDLAGYDSVFLDCKYFKSSTLMWGSASLQFIFSNGVMSDTIGSTLTSTDAWAASSTKLNSGLLGGQVSLKINLGGGEGVGVDNLQIYGFVSTAGIDNVDSKPEVKVFPNPTTEKISITSNKPITSLTIADLSGRVVLQNYAQNSTDMNLSVSFLTNGVYLLGVTDINGKTSTRKIIVQH
jgi:hypothetical protein